ncbi:MAG TPA: class I SAM-dependent methyltransferase [Stellaceae bacterium]|jgi:ubiquinone/menaquinone biosynthesis C-methylase UbiE|nr:class I SAM-dependent methyltransferase [Stellaceae bacterium]
MGLLSRFFALNRRLSLALEARLPEDFRRHFHTVYKFQVAEMLNRRPGQVAFDIGGGKDCPFLRYVSEPRAHTIIAFDCSEEQLRRNHDLESRVLCDAAANGLPVRDRSADLVVSRSVVEHIRDNQAFFENCARALRPGGTMIHAFPGRFAPFALMNQLLPNWLVRRLITYFLPEWVEEGNFGFVAFYDHCYFSAIKRLIGRNGLQNPRYILTYYQSIYFISFFPLFCLMVSYDLIVWRCGIRNLASGILVMAEQPPGRSDRDADNRGPADAAVPCPKDRRELAA